MITLTDVTVTYPDGDSYLTAVDSVSLSVPAGSFTAVTGPSGLGKSSLLAVAATLLRPSSGEVRIDDVATGDLSPAETAQLRREKVGIVFQQPNLLPALTAREQLVVMGELGPKKAEGGVRGSRRARRRALAERADELLDQVGLADRADFRPAQLSGGQRQRVNIARALMNHPSVLLVDEPTSALDRSRGAQIIDLLAQLTREEQTATLLVTHDLEQAGVCDACATMLDGRLSLDDDAKHLSLASAVTG